MSSRSWRAVRDEGRRRREREQAPSLDLTLRRLSANEWAELLGQAIGVGFYWVIAGVLLMAFTHGRWAVDGFWATWTGIFLIPLRGTIYALLRRGQPVRGWRMMAAGFMVLATTGAFVIFSGPLQHWAGIRVAPWEIYAMVVIVPVVFPVTLRSGVRWMVVLRLPSPERAGPDSLVWIDARLRYLQAMLESRTTWPVPVRDVVRAFGYCWIQRFRDQAGRQVADLFRAIYCFELIAEATPLGAPDEAGVSHDLADASFQRAQLMAASEDYLAAQTWIERIVGSGLAEKLPPHERDSVRRWVYRRTLIAAAWQRRLPAAGTLEVAPSDVVAEAIRGLTELSRAEYASLATRAISLMDIAEYHLLFAADLSGTEPLGRDEVSRHVDAAIDVLRQAEPMWQPGGHAELICRAMTAFALTAQVRLAGDVTAGKDLAVARDYVRLLLADPRIAHRDAAQRLPAGLTFALWAASWCLDADLGAARWTEVASLGQLASNGLQALFGAAVFRRDRDDALRFGRGLYYKFAYAVAMANLRPAETGFHVISLIEAARAVLLREALGLSGLEEQAGELEVRGHQALAARVREILARIAALENLELGAHDPDGLAARWLDASGQSLAGAPKSGQPLADAIAAVRSDFAAIYAEVTRALPPPASDAARQDFEQGLVATAATSGPLCYLLHMSRGADGAGPSLPGLAIVVTGAGPDADPVRVISIPGLTGDRVAGWLDRWDPAAVRREAARDLAVRGALLRELADEIMTPVFTAAGRPRRLVLMPDGVLSMLPLHAALVPTPDGDRQPLCAQAVVSYAPSHVVLRACLDRTAGPAGRMPASFLGVADPDDGLTGTMPELTAAAGHFPISQILSATAAPETVRHALAEHADTGLPFVAHFACHAYAAISDPLSSRVELGAGQESWLTLSDLLRTGLPGARLAVLSACQTGVPGSGEPDQYVSLAAGFIQSGAAGVIGTMCPVSDLTASRLMERFYALWARWPDDPAMALCTAQREMSTRGATVSVGDWVPFYYLGALPAQGLRLVLEGALVTRIYAVASPRKLMRLDELAELAADLARAGQ